MAKPIARIRLIEAVLVVSIVAVVGRAIQLQLVEGGTWAAEAARTRTVRDTLPAQRGALLDRDGTPLAFTQEFFHVGIAPKEVTEHSKIVGTVARALDLPASRVDRDFRSGKPYLYYHGPFTAAQVQPLRSFRGVHLEAEYDRFYPEGDRARPIIGSLTADGQETSGLENSLDSILRGRPGEQVLLKGHGGQRYESPSRILRQPVPGYDVILTLDNELQEIAEAGLAEAIGRLDAAGGDVVFYDARNGEILALASRQRAGNGFTARPTTLTDPFEPGSTAKLFTAAGLLTLGRVKPTDVEYAENGVWLMPVGTRGQTRRLQDSHVSQGSLTLAQAIRVSSNIVTAKFSLRLRPAEEYETLRNFGFGSPTGVEFPSESRGILRRPDQWTPVSGPSIAIGYELGVTPLQLAVAYGAIANDGILLSPTLVREVRDHDGRVLYRHRPEPVRRAVSPEVAAQLRGFLSGAVGEGGTGTQAQMVNYTLLGKTGTARRFGPGGYIKDAYNASFVALFPQENPEIVVVVKIDDPQGNYYGGSVAAPLTKSMLERALASRTVAIDRRRLTGAATPAAAAPAAAPDEDPEIVPVAWPWHPDSTAPIGAVVPATVGLPVRQAVEALHRRGFRVILHGLGAVTRSSPAAGDSATTGTAVTVWTGPGADR